MVWFPLIHMTTTTTMTIMTTTIITRTCKKSTLSSSFCCLLAQRQTSNEPTLLFKLNLLVFVRRFDVEIEIENCYLIGRNVNWIFLLIRSTFVQRCDGVGTVNVNKSNCRFLSTWAHDGRGHFGMPLPKSERSHSHRSALVSA